MTFDRSKVVDPLCDNLETYVGWRGYCSDMLVVLKNLVEKNDECVLREIQQIKKGDEFPFATYDLQHWQFFYPVEPPKKEPKLVPFDNCQELIDWYWDTGVVSPKNAWPLIWVKHKGVGFDVLISGYNRGFVCVENTWKNMRDLFKEYTFLDGTPIGKEVEE